MWRHCINFIPPIFGNLWYAKNRNKKQKTGTKAPYGCKNWAGNPVWGVCVLVRGTHMPICIHPHTSLQYLRNLPHILSCVRNMMLPLECSFRTISMLACGRFGSTGHALQGGGVPYIPPRYPVHFPGGQADAPWQASPPGIEPGSSGSKSTNLTTRPFGGQNPHFFYWRNLGG